MDWRRYRMAAGGAAIWSLIGFLAPSAAPGPIARIVGARVGPAGGGPPADDKSGLHIPPGRNVSFTYNMTDGAGFRWDIQYYGTVGQGTNYVYSGGLYLQVDGTSVHSNGMGWANPAGDELEIGPFNRGSVRIYRRIRVSKDAGLARWLDIYENANASQEVSLNVQVYTNTNWTINERYFSTGKDTFTDKDCAFITTSPSGNNPPALWHYVCGPTSKVRPGVSIQNNQIYVRHNLKVPAGKSIVVCYFESQNHSVEELKKLMRTFRPERALKDLPSPVRRLIVNIPCGEDLGGVELERIESGDTISTVHGDPIYGRITNKSFVLDTYFGRMDLPAEQVVGMAAVSGEEGLLRALLTGGQILAGRCEADARLDVTLPDRGTLRVPLTDIRQWAYRISKDRPEDLSAKEGFTGPVMVLRTGDRVAIRTEGLPLKLRSRHGVVDLKAADLTLIAMDNPGNGVHRVTFLNGSRLAGFLEPERLPVTLQLGSQFTVPRDLLAQMQFAAEEKPDPALDAAALTNGDELFGRLTTPELTVQSDYGTVTLKPENIQSMSFSPTHVGRVVIQRWDGSVLRGQCRQDTLTFQVSPGPAVQLHVGQVSQVRRQEALPPLEDRQKLERLVGQLGAESYKDRQAATEELLRMGKGILPMLRKFSATTDPEVRQRLEDVMEKLGGIPTPPAPPGPMIMDQ